VAAETPFSRVAISQAEDSSMKKALIAAVMGGFIVTGAAVIYAANSSSGTRLILGNGPITEQQIRDKLTADGFSNMTTTMIDLLVGLSSESEPTLVGPAEEFVLEWTVHCRVGDSARLVDRFRQRLHSARGKAR
jgi:hypothetical protein